MTSAPFEDSAIAERALPALARAGVDHHCHVDIVEMALGDELLLAEHEFDLAAGDAAEPLLDIDEFLGRHRKKHDLAGEVLGDVGAGQSDRGTQHPGDLGVVAAAVRRAGARVGERVVGGTQAVELADECQPRPRRAARKPALDPGQRQSRARRQSERAHPLGDESRGPGLVEAGFGVAQDGFAEIDDRVGMAVDRLANGAFQLVLSGHGFPPLRLAEPTWCLEKSSERRRASLALSGSCEPRASQSNPRSA